MRKVVLAVLLFAFLGNTLIAPPACAQELILPQPGVRVGLSPTFNPPVLKGIKVHPENPFRFDFILDKGTDANSAVRPILGQELGSVPNLKDEANKLIKYFLASLTVPEKDLWVNLSPYEKDRIVPQSFGLTEMGRDLLAQDYLLKQITASLIYPEDEFGKKFWSRVYEEAGKKFGTTNIPVNTFNKVWIVPEKAVVYENAQAGTAYVVESKLKVMLEQDYLALDKNVPSPSVGRVREGGDVNALGSQIVREIVIPQLTKEINENKNFTQLRQVYNSLILATWYKKKIKDSILNKVYADRNKIKGTDYTNSVINQTPTRGHVTEAPASAGDRNVSPSRLPSNPTIEGESTPGKSLSASPDTNDIEGIYQQYLQAFKKGVYNYIKEEQDPITQQMIPRKYFSGGLSMNMAILTTTHQLSDQAQTAHKDLSKVSVDMAMFDSLPKSKAGEENPLDQYFKELNRRSAPQESIIFEDISFPGNETISMAQIEGPSPELSIKNIGGVLIGTGAGHVLEFAFHGNVEDAYVVDINPLVTEIVWPIILELYGSHDNRLGFFEELFSTDLNEEERRGLQNKTVANILHFMNFVKGPSVQKVEGTIKKYVKLLKPHVSPQVQPYLYKTVAGFFYDLPQRFRAEGQRPKSLPFIVDFSLSAFRDIDKIQGTLSSESAYLKMRSMILAGRIKIVTGDLTGNALEKISDEIKSQSKQVSMVYLSNVIEWIKGAKSYQTMLESLEKISSNGRLILLQTVHGGSPFLSNQYLKGFISVLKLGWNLPSNHSEKYRSVMMRLLIGTTYGVPYINSLSLKITVLCNRAGHAFKGLPEEKFWKEVEYKIGKINPHAAGIYHKNQFNSLSSLQNFLNERGIKNIDPFDLYIIAQVYEDLGILRKGASEEVLAPRDRAMFSNRRTFMISGAATLVGVSLAGPHLLFGQNIIPVIPFEPLVAPVNSVAEAIKGNVAATAVFKKFNDFMQVLKSKGELIISVNDQNFINPELVKLYEETNGVFEKEKLRVLIMPYISELDNTFKVAEFYVHRPSIYFSNVYYAVPLGEPPLKPLVLTGARIDSLAGRTQGHTAIVDVNKVEQLVHMIRRRFAGLMSFQEEYIELLYAKQWPKNNITIEVLRSAFWALVAIHEYEHTRLGDEVAALLAGLILSPLPFFSLSSILVILKATNSKEYQIFSEFEKNLKGLTEERLRSRALELYVNYRKQSFFDKKMLDAARGNGINVDVLQKLDERYTNRLFKRFLDKALKGAGADSKLIKTLLDANVEVMDGVYSVTPADRHRFIDLVRKGSASFSGVLNQFKEKISSYTEEKYANPARKVAAEAKNLQDQGRVQEGNTMMLEANRLSAKFVSEQKRMIIWLQQGALLFNSISVDLDLKGEGQLKVAQSGNVASNVNHYEIASLDAAMLEKAPGGIDLTAGKMPLEIQKDSQQMGTRNEYMSPFFPSYRGFPLVIDPAMLQQLQDAPGFMPVIINIQPLNDLPAFLGVNV